MDKTCPALFVEEWPFIGKVPMLFFVPKETPERAELSMLITAHGGQLVEAHECFTYQIAPIKKAVKNQAFFAGEVYSAHWLIESVKDGELRDKDGYLRFVNSSENCMKLSFRKAKIGFTLTEAIKVFEIAVANVKGS